MRLDEWLAKNAISQSDFAKALVPPLTQGQISHYITGHTPIPTVAVIQIERLTENQVTLRDWEKVLAERCEIPDARTLRQNLNRLTA